MTKRKIRLREVQWAEMAPDVYGGKVCDRIIPRWLCSALDDKGGTDTLSVVQLNAKTFPSGTKIVISEPVCPLCDCFRWPVKGGFAEKCDCGFNWDEWTRNEYS